MSHKRTIPTLCVVVVLVILALGAASCSSSDSTANNESTVTEATATVGPQEPIVIRAEMSGSLKHFYRTVDEFISSDAVDTMVRGRVQSTKDVFLEHLALRILQVEVQKSFKGEPAVEITVYEDGGIVPLKDVLPDVEGHFDPSSLSDEEIANTVVDYRFEGAAHSEVGDQVILFLRRNPNPSQGDSYQIVMSVYGRFTLDSTTGEYVRPDMQSEQGVSGFESRESSKNMEAKLTQMLAH